MEPQLIFWMLITVAAVELLAISLIGASIKGVLRSESFRKKMERVNERKRQEETASGKSALTIVLLLAASAFPMLAFGQDAEPVTFAPPATGGPYTINPSDTTLYLLLTLDIVLFGVLWYLKGLLLSLVNVDKTEEELAAEKAKAPSRIMHVLTDAVPIEEEYRVETDHEYDGIRELDNNLPPWWKWGFYISIVAAVLYLINYHVIGISDLQIEAYKKDSTEAEVAKLAYLESQALNVDENTATLMVDAGDLRKGQGTWTKFCAVCHGAEGGGAVGPNMTDEYWLYGGDVKDLFKTIKYGAKRGMKSWKDELNPVQIQQVASYILTLQGTNPPNPKAAEGELYVPAEEPAPEEGDVPGTDSTAADTLLPAEPIDTDNATADAGDEDE